MSWLLLMLALALVIGGWKYPRLLVPLLIAALPLEISRTWLPQISFLKELGNFVGVIDFGRIMAFAVILYFIYISATRTNSWAADFKFGRRQNAGSGSFLMSRAIWRDRLFLTSGSYILFGLLSVIWSVDRTHTLTGTARLGILWLLGLAVYRLIAENRDFWLVPQSFAVMGTALAAVGIFEVLTRHYLWLGPTYQALNRLNGTFVDPNIYARFLVLGMLATLVWLLSAVPRAGKTVGYATLVIQLIALLATGSRTGWFACFLALILFAFFVPRKSLYLILGGGAILGVTALLVNPEVANRIMDLRHGLWAASTERQYLWKAGWAMFTGHPLLGVGLGGFQKLMLTRYAAMIQNHVSLSHTALMTTASELGIIGLGLTAVFLFFLFSRSFRARQVQRICTEGSERRDYALLTVFAVLGVLVVFLSAQGEGRFWEDPYLWILLGLLGALADVEGVN